MSDTEIVIDYQTERELWYVHFGDATAVVSAQDMVNEYYRWRYAGAPGIWRERAVEFCRAHLPREAARSKADRSPLNRPSPSHARPQAPRAHAQDPTPRS